jgi:hypothetical protein
LAERFPSDYVIFDRATVSVVANFHFRSTKFGSAPNYIAEESLSGS